MPKLRKGLKTEIFKCICHEGGEGALASRTINMFSKMFFFVKKKRIIP